MQVRSLVVALMVGVTAVAAAQQGTTAKADSTKKPAATQQGSTKSATKSANKSTKGATKSATKADTTKHQ